MNDIFVDDSTIDGNVPAAYRDVQAMLDRFVEINYETACDAARLHTGGKVLDANHIRQQIIDVIRNNPTLATVPTYFRDGRENYLWYSDFYDDVPKDVLKQYGKFIAPATPITPANYAAELARIDLPYFKELVDLISLEKLYTEAVSSRTPSAVKPEPEDTLADVGGEIISVEEPEAAQPAKAHAPEAPQPERSDEETKPKRSYEPKLNNEQYALLAECVESIRLFRRPVKVTQLKKLFNGKLTEPLQVMNQPSLICLLDNLKKSGYIKTAWMIVATENMDFISFRKPGVERRYGPGPHYLGMDQFKSRRNDAKHSYIHGEENIEDMIEKMQKCRDK